MHTLASRVRKANGALILLSILRNTTFLKLLANYKTPQAMHVAYELRIKSIFGGFLGVFGGFFGGFGVPRRKEAERSEAERAKNPRSPRRRRGEAEREALGSLLIPLCSGRRPEGLRSVRS